MMQSVASGETNAKNFQKTSMGVWLEESTGTFFVSLNESDRGKEIGVDALGPVINFSKLWPIKHCRPWLSCPRSFS